MPDVTNILIVGAGSCLGGMARYVVGTLIQSRSGSLFPWGTLAVNVIGCFLMGIIVGLIGKGVSISDGLRLFVTVGFCGGFTTFSTFMHENTLLLDGGNFALTLIYAAVSLVLGLGALYAALRLI
ncbi:MAG: fluoride efflux transporter CrcB [Bacteroidales bacterium]|nr:fluoride efflux transporter CrcB [Bacteroidales bacterium]